MCTLAAAFFLAVLGSPLARAQNDKLDAKPSAGSCHLFVGLVGHLKSFSDVHLPLEECKTSCRSTIAHWDHENMSTRCEFQGQVFSENRLELLDINWATCRIDTEQIRVNHRDCVRACADRVKRLSKGLSAESLKCEWDERAISITEAKASGGVFP